MTADTVRLETSNQQQKTNGIIIMICSTMNNVKPKNTAYVQGATQFRATYTSSFCVTGSMYNNVIEIEVVFHLPAKVRSHQSEQDSNVSAISVRAKLLLQKESVFFFLRKTGYAVASKDS